MRRIARNGMASFAAQASACVQFQVTENPKFHELKPVLQDRAIPFTDRKKRPARML